MTAESEGRPLRRWPVRALVAYAIVGALLYLGRWWIGGVIERAQASDEALPALLIFAIEALTGPGWVITVAVCAGALAAALARRLDGTSRKGLIGGLLLYGFVMVMISGDLGRAVGAGSLAVQITTWAGLTAVIWAPFTGLSAIRIIEWFVRRRIERHGA